eukprot:TRINITY_DN8697_c0_g1_i1.p1 TRINITY_DN8697_c0_g1~~TRINITY_DN8697_c0_g1_i1.p1  ORF type:complete len:290 (+),score=52.38 TRINITY_DN8697_c0_g1_i1:42-872(+)
MGQLESFVASHIPSIGMIMIALFFVRYVWTIISPKVIPLPSHLGTEKKNNTRLSLLYLLQLIGSVLFGEYITRGQPWRLDYDQSFANWHPDMIIEEGVEWYYCWQIAFYAYQLCNLFIEERKKDFIVMGLHHVITIILVSMAVLGKVHYIGAVLMLSFDKSDVLLESAKIFNRLEFDKTSVFFFILFVISWIVYRVIEYPLYIISAAIRSESIAKRLVPVAYTSSILLIAIYFMQVYWSYFIIKKVIGFIKKGIKDDGGDPREEDFKEKKEKPKKN